MTTGFETRKKGKSIYAQVWTPQGGLYVGGTAVTPSAADLNTRYNGATVTTSTTTDSLDADASPAIINSTAIVVISLGPPTAGLEKTILNHSTLANIVQVSTAQASGVTINSSSATNMAFGGKGTVTLLGVSTARWDIKSVYPGSTTADSILTLSTSS